MRRVQCLSPAASRGREGGGFPGPGVRDSASCPSWASCERGNASRKSRDCRLRHQSIGRTGGSGSPSARPACATTTSSSNLSGGDPIGAVAGSFDARRIRRVIEDREAGFAAVVEPANPFRGLVVPRPFAHGVWSLDELRVFRPPAIDPERFVGAADRAGLPAAHPPAPSPTDCR